MLVGDRYTIKIKDDCDIAKELECNEIYYDYVPSEIIWLLKTFDFKVIDIFGAKLSAFGRNELLTTEDYEMLVIAEK